MTYNFEDRITALENVSSTKKFIDFSHSIKWEFGKKYTAPSNGFIFINSDGEYLTNGYWHYKINGIAFKIARAQNVPGGVFGYYWAPISFGDVFETSITDNGGYNFGPQYFYPIG